MNDRNSVSKHGESEGCISSVAKNIADINKAVVKDEREFVQISDVFPGDGDSNKSAFLSPISFTSLISRY